MDCVRLRTQAARQTGAPLSSDVTWVAGALLFPTVAGLLQWRLVLRRHISRNAGWWVPAGLVGFFAGAMASWPVSAALGLNGKAGGLDAVVTWTVIGTGYGAITGLWLTRLLRRPAPDAPAESE